MFLLYGVFRRILFWGQLFCLWNFLAAPKSNCDVSFNDIQCFTRDNDDLCCAAALIDSSSGIVDYTGGVEPIDVCEAFRVTLRNVLCLHIDSLEYDLTMQFAVCAPDLFGEGIFISVLDDLNENAQQVFKELAGSCLECDVFEVVEKELSSDFVDSGIDINDIDFVSMFKNISGILVNRLGIVSKRAVPLVKYRLEGFLRSLASLKSKCKKSLDIREKECKIWAEALKVFLVKKGRNAEARMVDNVCKLLKDSLKKHYELKEEQFKWFKQAIDFVLMGKGQQPSLIRNQLAQLVRLSGDIMLLGKDISILLDRMRDQTSRISIAINPVSIPILAKYRSCRR